MAKLNVLVPAVDVEVIGVGGSRTKYRKVERDAKAGDILKITDNSGDDYVVEGAFYEVKYLDCAEDPQILDEDGEETDTAGMRFEVYEKVAESPALVADEITFEGDKYRKVGRDAKEGDVIKITEPDDEDDPITVGGLYRIESVDWNGDPQITDNDGNEFDTYGSTYEVYEKVAAQYREVKRPAKVGERIKIVDAQMAGGDYENGDEMVVTETRWPTSHAVNADFNGNQVHVWYAEYVVLEPIAEKPELKRLTVGDYAKVVGPNDNKHNYEIGSVVKIVSGPEDRGDRVLYEAERADGTRGNYLRSYHLQPATEAEFLAQNRLKVGDFAKVIAFPTAYNRVIPEGTIVKIKKDDQGDIPFLVGTLDGKEERWAKAEHLTHATESEVAAAKQALKFGDFEDGDYAQIVNATRDNASLDARNNADKFVTVTRETHSGAYRGLKLTLSDGKFAGYANADALRKVSKEEYEAATDPRNQFAKGDAVRVVKTGTHFAATGQILRVYDIVDYGPNRIRCEHLNGKREGCDHFYAHELKKLSAEEIVEIEKWAAIGRKVNEFKPGDLVRIVANTTASVNNVGDYGTVANGPGPKTGRYQVDAGKGTVCSWTEPADMKLIVPVEHRFDRTEDVA